GLACGGVGSLWRARLERNAGAQPNWDGALGKSRVLPFHSCGDAVYSCDTQTAQAHLMVWFPDGNYSFLGLALSLCGYDRALARVSYSLGRRELSCGMDLPDYFSAGGHELMQPRLSS